MTAFMFVMPGRVPGIHDLAAAKTWMAGTHAKPRFALWPGHDVESLFVNVTAAHRGMQRTPLTRHPSSLTRLARRRRRRARRDHHRPPPESCPMTPRPSLYTPELADRILAELRAGRPVNGICNDAGMPCRDTVFEWVREDREGFGARYREARAAGHGQAGYVGYTREIAEAVLAELMGGRTLSEVCGTPGMPGFTAVNRWIATDREGFAERYKAARQVGQLRQAQVRYSAEIAEAVLGELMAGRPLREICAESDMPSAAAVQNWLNADRDGFKARYLEARTIGCLVISADLLSIVDDRDNDWITQQLPDGSIETVLDPDRVKRAELRVKTRRWLLAKMLPKTFGDRLDITARQEGRGASAAELAEMMKLINGRSRGLPGEDFALDESSALKEDLPGDED
jgi:hypothetical protein